ncbi:hypothetical protein T265_10767 [Opisthorchis viverrini]|uniref:Uncharacterized protein n=1 Tax=Opisthorchis viverrini TaxID=6198 RepID=A0A074Z128_OPIVI|nr:hypothetical protein T265_10767 [Opisthorchis viverrini]KER20746.1 hypothetical protein T265_10767 [Opisthorchis viverrini]
MDTRADDRRADELVKPNSITFCTVRVPARALPSSHSSVPQYDRPDDANSAASPHLVFWFLIFHRYNFLVVSGKKPPVPPHLVFCSPSLTTNDQMLFDILSENAQQLCFPARAGLVVTNPK